MNIRQIDPVVKLTERKRVCAYARVSSGSDAMLNSLCAQIDHYSKFIGQNPEWEYGGVYADEAITGTKEARPGFQEMLSRCRAGKIQIIITKSISRFARNTVTVLESVRELKALGVDIFFERENVHSLSNDGELLLSILSSFAQEESRSVSENVKWRIRKDFSEGKICGMSMRGYRLVDGVLTVVPEEAALVRSIFSDYLSGMGVIAIVKKYREQGIKLSRSGVSGMLRNEKYRGDMLLQKSYVKDHISKRKVRNTGQLPQFHIEDSHEAIIDAATWDAVQVEIARRAAIHTPKQPFALYPFSGKIRCGICGAPYKRKHANAGKTYEKIVWICTTFDNLGKSSCPSQQIPDDILTSLAEKQGGVDKIEGIQIPGHNRVVFTFHDGRTSEATWQNPSRSRSWTPEMREAARQRGLKQWGKEEIT